MSTSFHLQRQRLVHLLRLNPCLFSPQNLLQIQAKLTTTGLLFSEPSCLLSLLNLSLSSSATVHQATALFIHTQTPNVAAWPIMVRRLNLDNEPFQVFSLFKAMQRLKRNDPVCDSFVFASLIKACNKLSALREGKSVHCHVVRLGLDYNVNLLNSVVSFYSCSKSLVGYACAVFDRIPHKTVVTVNCMLSGFVKNNLSDAGLGLFNEVLRCGFGLELKPNYVTLVILISGCVEFDEFSVGKALHSYCCRTGLDLVNEVCNALIDLYSKFGRMDEAASLFNEMPERDLISWNTMIAGYAGVSDCRRAFSLFRKMRERGVGFDRVSFICLILAACNSGDLEMGKVVHGYMTTWGTEITVDISTALTNLYCKCGQIACAKKVLDEVADDNIALWNSMIHGYVKCGHNQEALGLFNQIRSRKLRPDEVTMVGLILACRNSGDLSHGIDIHSYVESCNHLQGSIVLHNAIIDMYAKCGSMNRAKVLFDKIPKKDVVSWTSIIVGHAINGEGKESLLAFRKMCAEKVEPNSVTFIGVLSACDHAGLVDEGLNLYDAMCKFYHIKPTIEHCGCIIDMLARAGRLEEAHKFVRSMPIEPNAVVWRMLINACRVHGDFDRGLCLVSGFTDPKTLHGAEDHVTSSNILADAGRWDDVLHQRSLMAIRKAPKVSAKSSVSDFTE
ncbi:pentatricopeptide repeat-containing protein At1g06140, mitochondrial-like [Prunus avium]|uniref:Pentatricopeptide repeat-containing protein At1g06140, mitochondrial-like n=1 Tax=Prunus avium TaxID=42229 RepID=A0A6P5SUY2_PRUAV|nr:pentatricopeptide repeat-containing protein At1g06140, mitochondrial-like [Prunus avium]